MRVTKGFASVRRDEDGNVEAKIRIKKGDDVTRYGDDLPRGSVFKISAEGAFSGDYLTLLGDGAEGFDAIAAFDQLTASRQTNPPLTNVPTELSTGNETTLHVFTRDVTDDWTLVVQVIKGVTR